MSFKSPLLQNLQQKHFAAVRANPPKSPAKLSVVQTLLAKGDAAEAEARSIKDLGTLDAKNTFDLLHEEGHAAALKDRPRPGPIFPLGRANDYWWLIDLLPEAGFPGAEAVSRMNSAFGAQFVAESFSLSLGNHPEPARAKIAAAWLSKAGEIKAAMAEVERASAAPARQAAAPQRTAARPTSEPSGAKVMVLERWRQLDARAKAQFLRDGGQLTDHRGQPLTGLDRVEEATARRAARSSTP